jgi:hypothetical protein
MEQTQSRRVHRPLIHRLRLQWLLVFPILLAIAAAVLLFVHSDWNIAALWSQCHARSRLHGISHIPVIGTPSCFLISFFQFADDSIRSFARMSVILSFVGALLAVSLVESARMCNKLNWIISKPTFPWVVFNLAGGALVWDLVIVPAFFVQAKEIQDARESRLAERVREAEPAIDQQARALDSQVEVWAIAVAVAVGFYVPSIVMLVLNHPAAIAVWLFFPLWVALIRYVVKVISLRIIRDPQTYHMESHIVAIAAIYGLPVIFSLMSHVFFIVNLFCRDDCKEMTKSALQLIEIDVLLIWVTMLYWVLVETEVFITAAMAGLSILFGPGTALCWIWLLREKAIEAYPDDTDTEDVEAPREESNEQTPLLT